VLSHGTVVENRDGLIRRIADRGGVTHAELIWVDHRLERLAVTGAVVSGEVVAHPLLGDAHPIGETAMTALDWARPTRIPTVAEPARLPPGSGAMILNVIAMLAEAAGVPALRYAGPYPTPALYRTLQRAFRTTASEAEFCANVMDRALRVARDEISIDFVPAPFERIAHAHGFVELRDAMERAVIDGVAYDVDGSPARLVDGAAEIWFGDRCYARVASFSPNGALVDGPHAIPRCTSPVVGRAFPDELRDAIADLVADAVASPLASGARARVAATAITWQDLGGRAARRDGNGFAVHAAIWEHVAPHGLARVALAIAEALAPVVAATVVDEVMVR
jgi:hypothetical protein